MTRLTMLRGFAASVAFADFVSDNRVLLGVAFAADAQASERMCRLCQPVLEQPLAPAAERQGPRITEAFAAQAIAKTVGAGAVHPRRGGGGPDISGAFKGSEEGRLPIESPAISSTSLRTGAARAGFGCDAHRRG